MLNEIVNETSTAVLIADTADRTGLHLWLCWSKILALNGRRVHLICFAHPPDVYSRITDFPTSTTFYDASTAASPLTHDLSPYLAAVESRMDVVVAIDTLDLLVLHNGADSVCLGLQRLMREGCSSLVLGLHTDLHPTSTVSCLRHFASTVVTVLPPSSPAYFCRCHILHKRASGKIFKQTEECAIEDDYTKITSCTVADYEKIAHRDEGVDPTTDLTFNLKLTDVERKARDKVVLPHVQDVQRGAVQVKGEIFYEPDEQDDFDEEDPDNDLYI